MDVGILADSKYLSWHMLFSFSADKAIISARCCYEHDVRERPFFGLISQPCSRWLQHFVLFLWSFNLLLISVSAAQSSMYVPHSFNSACPFPTVHTGHFSLSCKSGAWNAWADTLSKCKAKCKNFQPITLWWH